MLAQLSVIADILWRTQSEYSVSDLAAQLRNTLSKISKQPTAIRENYQMCTKIMQQYYLEINLILYL